jgi:chromosome segregation ATPase
MSFTVEEFRDLVRILDERTEWRVELRRLVLTDELLALPSLVQELTEAQRRSEERLGRLEEALTALAEAQRRTEERLEALTERVDRLTERLEALTEGVDRLIEQVEALAEAQRRTEKRLDRLTDDVGELKGDNLERRYRERVFAYFARLVRGGRALSAEELIARLERAVEQQQLSEEEAEELSWADLVIRGRRRADDVEVYLVVEVSWGVGLRDVERAVQRAALLARTGVPALAVVAGRGVTDEAAELAQVMKVWQFIDGRAVSPEP